MRKHTDIGSREPPTPSVPRKDVGIGIFFLFPAPRVAKVLVFGDEQLVDP